MRRNILVFLFGFLAGVTVIHFLEGPLDLGLLREEASEALDEAGRGARDLRLTTAVRTALALHKNFSLFDIDVEADAEEGVVTLQGEVGSADERSLAELITRGVDGVDIVVNRLEVHRAPEPTQG
ncbi:MAG TPA: BON domain-containing protein [Acidobacteriota bacterium]|nr:BON domain-containing protein [Acidobacteriota bacterium]